MSLSILFSATVANAAGGGNGEAVSTAVSAPFTAGSVPPRLITGPSGPLVNGYAAVLINPSQPCMWNVNEQLGSGFTVTLQAALGVTLEAGSFEVVVLG